MEASPVPRHHLPPPSTSDKIKQKLLKNGVSNPSPKIIHTLRKKETQKHLRKQSKKPQALTLAQEKEAADFQVLKSEYKGLMVGNPWEEGGLERERMREIAGSGRGEGSKSEQLRELGGFLERERERFRWLLDDDVAVEEGWEEREREEWVPRQRRGGEDEAVRFLVDKLSSTELNVRDYKFSRMMKHSKLQFTEDQLLKIVNGLGNKGQWSHSLSVVEWVYSSKEHSHCKSRYVYTKLLAVLGKAQRPCEALQIFDLMRDDAQIYPDMAAYHSISVTLGQTGYLKELIKIIETMREKPSRRIKNMRRKNWDPTLQPDIVVFNAVLNACVPSRQWRGVSWVFQQLRKHSLKPNGPTYGLAMEVMLHSGKYDLVHEFFDKMKRSGEAPKALTYKVLVSAFWEEGKVDEAVKAVRDMEKRGVVGAASVYYELACCLCNEGRWKEAMTEVEKMKHLTLTKPLQVTFTGMIMSSLDGGHVNDCISIFKQSKDHCDVDAGLVNAMLKVYGINDMFFKAKEIFEETKTPISDSYKSMNGVASSLGPDAHTYTMMLKSSASAQQWDYFEFVYREMVLSGYVIDQSKHIFLLVEASRAGKWLLLEHAFDNILEAGEIPHLSFFTELICQAIYHRDFERGINLINALAYAPPQMSEKQWLDFFEKNGDRIGRENLNELVEVLKYSELPNEATVSNLRRSLISYFKKDPSTGNIGKVNSDENEGRNDSSLNSLGTYLCDDLHDDSKRNILNVTNSDSINGDADVTISNSLEDLDFGVVFGESDDDSDDNFECIDSDDEEMEEDMQICLHGAIVGTDQPSANEILESWKQSREKDGTTFFISPIR